MSRLIYADELHEIINWTHMKPPFSKKAIHRYIDMARTVEAEPVRHGRWITYFETDEGRSLRCSKCRMVFWVGHGRDGNYCPNCGAKMDEVEEE